MNLTSFSGYLQAFSAVFFWSLNTVLATLFLTDLSPIEFAFGRWFFALLILLPLAWNGIKKNKRYFVHRWIWIVGLAITGIVLDNTLLYVAAKTTSSIDMGLLNALGPIFLCLLTWIFLRAHVYLTQIVGIFCAVVGVVIIVSKGNWHVLSQMNFSVGEGWMIINALCFGVYSFLQNSRPNFVSQKDLLGITVFVGVLILLPIFLWQTPLDRLKVLGTQEYSVLLYLGIFNSVIAYLMWNSALKEIGPIKTSIVYYLMPVLTMIEAVVIMDVTVSRAEIVGGIIVMTGIFIVGLGHRVRFSPLKQTKRKNG